MRVCIHVKARCELDDDGRLISLSEDIVDGFGVEATIARYNFLTARRPAGQPAWLWYLRVLRFTVVEEARSMSDDTMSADELQNYFVNMLVRNLALGSAIGIATYAAVKVAKVAIVYGTILRPS